MKPARKDILALMELLYFGARPRPAPSTADIDMFRSRSLLRTSIKGAYGAAGTAWILEGSPPRGGLILWGERGALVLNRGRWRDATNAERRMLKLPCGRCGGALLGPRPANPCRC